MRRKEGKEGQVEGRRWREGEEDSGRKQQREERTGRVGRNGAMEGEDDGAKMKG